MEQLRDVLTWRTYHDEFGKGAVYFSIATSPA